MEDKENYYKAYHYLLMKNRLESHQVDNNGMGDNLGKAVLSLMRKSGIPSVRENSTGIGMTTEHELGIKENNSCGPDVGSLEVKSHRIGTHSPITLFTLSPTSENKNAYLMDNYGESYPENPSQKKLHVSIFADRKSTYARNYSFKLYNNPEKKIVEVRVYDGEELTDNSVYYTYTKLEERLNAKLKHLLLLRAKSSYANDGGEMFDYKECIKFTDTSFDKFLKMLDVGKIQYDIRIGRYQSGVRKGRSHDHGSAFRIKEEDLTGLYLDKKTMVSKVAHRKAIRYLKDLGPEERQRIFKCRKLHLKRRHF